VFALWVCWWLGGLTGCCFGLLLDVWFGTCIFITLLLLVCVCLFAVVILMFAL